MNNQNQDVAVEISRLEERKAELQRLRNLQSEVEDDLFKGIVNALSTRREK
jgi:hypothetical protein